MKKVFFISLLTFAIGANAQLLDFGIVGGLNFVDLKLDGNSQITDITTENGGGLHIGAMARVNLVLFYVQPALLYTSTSSKFSLKADGIENAGTYDLQRIDVPIPVGLKLGPAAIFAGPIASFAIGSPSEIFNDSYKAATWGYQVGVGLKLLGILAEVKYEGAFSNQAKTATIGGEQFDLDARQSMVIVSVGYFF
jgi:hypothetical protein